MNKLHSNNAVHPQTVEVPEPLTVHPSVDPELARGLISAVEYIYAHPEEFSMESSDFNNICGPRGCAICHAERLSGFKRNRAEWSRNVDPSKIPLGDGRRIYDIRFYAGTGFDWSSKFPPVARIEHFLRTGQ